ncbi:MAG: nitroreductase family protein [Candidatus Falkowbacteria bacterium]
MRQSEYPIQELLLNRWSSRRMSDQPITQAELMSLFEAARWAPSSYNEQPWRFIYALPGDDCWQDYFNLLTENNQAWVSKAATLVVAVSKQFYERDHSANAAAGFDVGAAVENIALEAGARGLAFHVLGGIDYAKATEQVGLPEGYKVEVMLAIGHLRVDVSNEEPEKQTERKALAEIIAAKKFNF